MSELLILTGPYGAGRSLAIQYFQEAGFFVTDNIPLETADDYFSAIEKEPKKYEKVALTIGLGSAKEVFEIVKKHSFKKVKPIGITCSPAVLYERFRLTRKIHPRQPLGYTLEECVEKDLNLVREIRDYFDVYIDTTTLSPVDFRKVLFETCVENRHRFTVNFVSFGYRISVPQDIETVFDVRLLPNPYWVPELKELNGLDKPVKDYVLKAPETKEFLKHVIKYLNFYLAGLEENGKNYASIGIACSGGQHRSVVIAEYLAKKYSKRFNVAVSHKDLKK